MRSLTPPGDPKVHQKIHLIVRRLQAFLSRLGVYVSSFNESDLDDSVVLIIAATVSAFIGAYLGNRLLKKVTLKTVQRIVTVMIFILSLALGFGLV